MTPHSLELSLTKNQANKLDKGRPFQMTHSQLQSGDGIKRTVHLLPKHYRRIVRASANGKGCRICKDHMCGGNIDNILVEKANDVGQQAIDEKTGKGFIGDTIKKGKRMLKPVLDKVAPALFDAARDGISSGAKKMAKTVAAKMGVTNDAIHEGIDRGIDYVARRGREFVKEKTGYGLKQKGRKTKGNGFTFHDLCNNIRDGADAVKTTVDSAGPIAAMAAGGNLKKSRRRKGTGVLSDIANTVDSVIGIGIADPSEKLQHRNSNVLSINDSRTPTGSVTKVNNYRQGVGSLIKIQEPTHGEGLMKRRAKAIRGTKNGLLKNPHDKVLTSKTLRGGSFMSLNEMA